MYTIYDEHIEVLEAENADLKEEVIILRRRLEYYKSVIEDENLVNEIDG